MGRGWRSWGEGRGHREQQRSQEGSGGHRKGMEVTEKGQRSQGGVEVMGRG